MKKVSLLLIPMFFLLLNIGRLQANEAVGTPPAGRLQGGVNDAGDQRAFPVARTGAARILEKRKRFNKLSKGTQRIYKVTMRSNVVYQLQTAIGHVSLIDLPEEALKVFVGDQELFKVEVYEKQVLVKPVTDEKDANTNLTIFTESARLTFDVTVGEPETAEFVMDFRMPEEDALVENAFKRALNEKYGKLERIFDKKTRAFDEQVRNLAERKIGEDLAGGVRVVNLGKTQNQEGVVLELLSLSRIGAKSYLSFKIENHSKLPYKVSHMALGFERFKRKLLRLRKISAGFIGIDVEVEIKSPIAPEETAYGTVLFDRQPKDKKETPVFRVFEEDGNRHFKVRGFKWVS